MALGQAAGVAAAISLEDKVAAEDINISKLQHQLLKQGAVLFYDPKIWDESNIDTFTMVQLQGLRGSSKD
jgi:hypothetical protein